VARLATAARSIAMSFMIDPVSEFFVVISMGDVTVIQLRDPADCHRDPPKQIDRVTSVRQRRGLPSAESIPPWQQFGNDLQAFLAANKPGKVVLDFAGRERMVGSSAVISTPLLSVYAEAKHLSEEWGCQWRICGLTEVVRSVYEVSSLHWFFPQFHDTRSEAIAAFCPIIAP
jgi:hypothetical protein